MEPSVYIDTPSCTTADSLGAIRQTLKMSRPGDSFVVWFGGKPHDYSFWTTSIRTLASYNKVSVRCNRNGRFGVLVRIVP